MNKTLITTSALAGLIFAGATIGTVSAQTAATETGLTEEQVIAIALNEVPGEVQEVDLERHKGMQIYEIEILAADGTEMEVEVAAETGDVLKVKEDGETCNKGGKKRDKSDDA